VVAYFAINILLIKPQKTNMAAKKKAKKKTTKKKTTKKKRR